MPKHQINYVIFALIALSLIGVLIVNASTPFTINTPSMPLLGIFGSFVNFFKGVIGSISHIFSHKTTSASVSPPNGNVIGNNAILPFSNLLSTTNYTLPALSNSLNQKIGSLQQLNVTYSINLNVSVTPIYLNFTYEQYGNNYRIDLSNSTSNLFKSMAPLRDSNGQTIAENYTITSFFRINGQNYACTNRNVCLNLSSVLRNENPGQLEVLYPFYPLNSSLQQRFLLPILNLSIVGMADDTVVIENISNSTLVNVSQRSYAGHSCTFVRANFTLITGSSLNGTSKKWVPTVGPEMTYTACLSNEYYVPLNFSISVPGYNALFLPSRALSIGKTVSQAYITTLPYRLINATTPIASVDANPSNFSGKVTVIGALHYSNLIAPINYEVVDSQGDVLRLQLPTTTNREWIVGSTYEFTGSISCGIVINGSDYTPGGCGTLQQLQNDATGISKLNGNINVTPYISIDVTNATIISTSTHTSNLTTTILTSSTPTTSLNPTTSSDSCATQLNSALNIFKIKLASGSQVSIVNTTVFGTINSQSADNVQSWATEWESNSYPAIAGYPTCNAENGNTYFCDDLTLAAKQQMNVEGIAVRIEYAPSQQVSVLPALCGNGNLLPNSTTFIRSAGQSTPTTSSSTTTSTSIIPYRLNQSAPTDISASCGFVKGNITCAGNGDSQTLGWIVNVSILPGFTATRDLFNGTSFNHDMDSQYGTPTFDFEPGEIFSILVKQQSGIYCAKVYQYVVTCGGQPSAGNPCFTNQSLYLNTSPTWLNECMAPFYRT